MAITDVFPWLQQDQDLSRKLFPWAQQPVGAPPNPTAPPVPYEPPGPATAAPVPSTAAAAMPQPAKAAPIGPMPVPVPDPNDPKYNPPGRKGFIPKLEAVAIGLGGGIPAAERFLNQPKTDAAAQLAKDTAYSKEQQAAQESAARIADITSQAGQRDAQAELERQKAANQPAKAPTNDFELWQQQNPGVPVSEWLKVQAGAKVPPSDTTKVSPIIESQIGVRPDRKSFQPGPEGDKMYAAADKSWGQAAEKITNDMAGAQGQARGAAYGRNRPVQVLDTFNQNRPVTVSAGEAEDNPQRYVTQSGGQQALPREALINDIRVSAQNVRKNLSVLDAKGFDRAKLAAALASPETTFQAYLQAIPRGSLNDQQQQAVADIFNLREQAMALRSVLGAGAGSEDMRRAILQTLPGVGTPGAGFGEKQIDNLLAVLDRVEKGIPNVPLTNRGQAPKGTWNPQTGKYE